jgi:putative ABC transport system substrate-binding protein
MLGREHGTCLNVRSARMRPGSARGCRYDNQMIGRRPQLAGMLSVLVVPRITAAQGKRRPRLAFFVPVFPEGVISETGGDPSYRIIFKELRQRGYEEGRTIDVERWSARGDPASYPELAREIVRSQPDVIYTVDTGQVQALLALTTTIPILAQNVSLVDAGLVESFSRPGRNVTGFSAAFSGLEFAMKRLQLLRDAVPSASRVALLMRRAPWDSDPARQFRAEASRIGVTMIGALLDDSVQPADYRRAFAAMAEQRIEAVWVSEASYNYVYRDLIVDLALGSRLPAITGWRMATERGGLMSYAVDSAWLAHMMADLIVRVLQGEKPADLPLRSPDKFEFVINLKTARALGIIISPAVLYRADEVIE